MAMNHRLLRPRASGAIHPDAIDWASRAVANGGTVDSTSLASASAFAASVHATGVRGRLAYVNLLIGSNLNAALVPLYRSFSAGGTTYGNAIASNTNFVSDNYSLASGLNAPTNNKFLDLGTTLGWSSGIFDLHWSVGMTDAPASGQSAFMYLFGDNNTIRGLSDINAGSWRSFLGGPGSSVTQRTSTRGGRLLTVRESQTSLRSYFDGVEFAQSTVSVQDETVSGVNTRFGVNQYSQQNQTYLYVTIGMSLTSPQVAALDAACVQHLTITGRL